MKTALKSPFQLLDAYTAQDTDKFFGRDDEVDALYEMIRRNRLVLVYGQSGTGKTSLINCGLAGRFDITDWYPLFIRRGDDINTSLQAALRIKSGKEKEKDIIEALQDIYKSKLRPVFLIFDQLEELFILGNKEDKSEQQQFIQSIAKILASDTDTQVIFLIREEFLGHLYDFESVVPSLFDRRLRVERMTTKKVKEVLEKSFQKFNITLEPPAEERIDEMIKKISDGKAWIQLPYLQVYLDMFWKEDYTRTYPDGRPGSTPPLEFTKKEIEEFGQIGRVLEKFLVEQEQNIQKELKNAFPAVPDNIVRTVLDAFATEEGTKRPISYIRTGDEIVAVKDRSVNPPEKVFNIPQDVVSKCLEALEKGRILRILDTSIELAHDSLAELIDRNRSDEDRQLNQIKRHLENNYQEHLKTGEFLSPKQINNYEDFLPKLTLEEHVSTFIEDSRGHNEKIRLAEIELNKKQLKEARERAEKEELLRNEAEEKGKKARRNFLISLIVAVAAGILGFIALGNSIALKDANASTVDLLLREIEQDILNLDYDAAREKTSAAIDLKAKAGETTLRLQEIAYFFTESGQYGKAAIMLNKIGLSLDSGDSLALRNVIKDINPDHLDSMENRYYPEMVLVPGGSFKMGNNTGEEDEQPVHMVDLDSFYMAKTETTTWQYYVFAEATQSGAKQAGWIGNHPVTEISWYYAMEYSNWVSEQKNLAKVYNPDRDTINWKGNGYRLPTEAEWEYAARGGPYWEQGFIYSGSDSLDLVGWYTNNSGGETHPVGTLEPNQLRIFDMSGNVWEWCWDWYKGDYYEKFMAETAINPPGSDSGDYRVLRGGGWYYYVGDDCRVSNRLGLSPDFGYGFSGFRCVRAF